MKCPTCGETDEGKETPLALFLEMQDYAMEQMKNASRADRAYWQGVKDGLRKAYTLFADEKIWGVICNSSNGLRPADAWIDPD